MIDRIFLKWKSSIEDSVKEYMVERSFDDIIFNSVGTLPAKGNFTDYQYIDTSIFKATTRTYYYRLKIVNKDDTFSHSKTLQLTPRVSSAKQTWGSIKAIFH